MIEAEWNASSEAQAMLGSRREAGRLTEPGLRLFWCACCRRIWQLIPKDYQGIVVAAERYANGQCELRDVREAENQAYREEGSQGTDSARWAVTYAGGEWILDQLHDGEETSHYYAAIAAVKPEEERAAQRALVREMFGHPLRGEAP